LVREIFFRPPKLGAMSPPMDNTQGQKVYRVCMDISTQTPPSFACCRPIWLYILWL